MANLYSLSLSPSHTLSLCLYSLWWTTTTLDEWMDAKAYCCKLHELLTIDTYRSACTASEIFCRNDSWSTLPRFLPSFSSLIICFATSVDRTNLCFVLCVQQHSLCSEDFLICIFVLTIIIRFFSVFRCFGAYFRVCVLLCFSPLIFVCLSLLLLSSPSSKGLCSCVPNAMLTKKEKKKEKWNNRDMFVWILVNFNTFCQLNEMNRFCIIQSATVYYKLQIIVSSYSYYSSPTHIHFVSLYYLVTNWTD